jgi:hypothetical protein
MVVRPPGTRLDREHPLDPPDRGVFDDDLVEDPVPRAARRPAPQPLMSRLPRAVTLRQIPPRRSRAQLPQDPIDHLAVIPPLATTTPTTWQQRPDPGPRRIRQLTPANHKQPTLANTRAIHRTRPLDGREDLVHAR